MSAWIALCLSVSRALNSGQAHKWQGLVLFPATASGGELVEGEAQSQTAALPERFGLDDGLVVLEHCEQPRACKRPVIAENASFVDRRAVSFDVALEPIHTVFGHGLGEEVLQSLNNNNYNDFYLIIYIPKSYNTANL